MSTRFEQRERLVLTGQAESRVVLQPPEEESKSRCSVIVNSCAQHLKRFWVRTQEKSCSDAQLSRVAGFRVCEIVLSCLSICQVWPFCRNVPFAMSSREVNIRTLQRSWARRPEIRHPSSTSCRCSGPVFLSNMWKRKHAAAFYGVYVGCLSVLSGDERIRMGGRACRR